eukprot:m.8382 g.8382  ORF g.8382 m.8382 type:complete len:475 (-) comp3881_c0_seq2:39-1463(-)
MMEGDELLTVQLGTTANVVASYYWKSQVNGFGAQDEATDLRPEVVFLPGSSRKPRAVIYDMNGSISRTGDVPLDDRKSNILWEGDVMRCDMGPMAISDIEWDNWKIPQLHQNSLRTLPNTDMCDTYEEGLALSRNAKFCDDFDDRFHYFLEACDTPQGVQLWHDYNQGFGGTAAGVLRHIRQDHGKIPIFSLGFADMIVEKTKKHASVLNTVKTLVDIYDIADMITPVSHNSWLDNAGETADVSLIESNAIELGLCLQAAMTPCSLVTNAEKLSAIMNLVSSGRRRKVSGLFGNSSIKLDSEFGYFSDVLHEQGSQNFFASSLTRGFFPGVPDLKTKSHAFVLSARGISGKSLAASAQEMRIRSSVTAYDRCRTASEMLMRYCGQSDSADRFHVYSSNVPVHSTENAKESKGCALGSLVSNDAIGDSLRQLEQRLDEAFKRMGSRNRDEDIELREDFKLIVEQHGGATADADEG